LSRRKARELAFKVLFQVDQVGAEPRKAFSYLLGENSLADKERDFSWSLIEGCLMSIDEIDAGLARYSRDWSLDRMSSVDRNIMRMASYEIHNTERGQAVVAIDEAIEIAKKYGDESSGSFVNAILDKVLGERE
jgi:N utilization substance protein B